MMKFANILAKPYLFIGGLPKKDPNSVMGRLRLQVAINILLQEHNPARENAALFLIGKCFQSLKDYQKALKYFKEVWNEHSFNLILFKEMSATCLELGNLEEGLQYAFKEVSQFPNNPESQANLAFFLFKNDRLNEAKDLIEKTYVKTKDNDFIKKVHDSIMNA